MTPKLCMKNNNNNKKIRITQEEKEDIFEHLPFQPKLLLLIQNCMLIAKDGFVQFLRLDLLVWLTDMKSHCSYTFCGSKKIPQDSQSSGRGKPRGVKTDNCCSFSSQLQIGNRYILVYPTSVLDSQVIFLRSTFPRSIDRIFQLLHAFKLDKVGCANSSLCCWVDGRQWRQWERLSDSFFFFSAIFFSPPIYLWDVTSRTDDTHVKVGLEFAII